MSVEQVEQVEIGNTAVEDLVWPTYSGPDDLSTVEEALADLDVAAIDAALVDGQVVVRVTAPADASDAVRDVLRDFTFPRSIEVAS